MRRLVNDGYEAVEEMLAGYVAAQGKYVDFAENDKRVIVSKQMSEEPRVRIIVGGGSGHEPLFLGYVGKDFADAAVVGNINTSPSPEPCYNAVKAVDSGKGCLYMYGNYAGDVMNFDMGAEMAADDGIRVETVLVTDDIYSAENVEDRRGVAGDLIVFKAAASAAAKGLDLDAVKQAAEKANTNTFSMGVALSSSTLPVTGKAIFEMKEGEMEVGMGIHGEPGIKRTSIEPADKVVDQIMGYLIEEMKLTAGEEVHVLINGLGGLPVMDQYICYRRVDEILKEKGVHIHNPLVGNYATSMDMIGMSITLVRLDDELKDLLDTPCDTPYFKVD
ncbi:dihydroxyacetone kinase subunit DhaK2 [Listeria monocytogenes]|uniref:dihydroxyacetone kinase subunit DhaK2 n=1 Tax=Listeria monocytogenes TaxID=1639 RepID=UPI000D6F18FC|nr:dihydroxyacetone kinase subunit DhaK2 [Listeria monocytogenes]EAC6873122.1 dihydroxyacetone kinase subunit DhaK [Listeria monocytogenes]EAD1932211.1 dihydroxyacetone kinase subunit DhaK [Listeria monocytogenes]EAG9321816.1 dihydroxyacetone kinase subunit DhaK [Listeria monocytogenes]PWR35908.1 dihydroxyacetone kinase [Listeria monocytogenes]